MIAKDIATQSFIIKDSSVIELRLSIQPLGNDAFIIGNRKTNTFLKVPYLFLYIFEMTDGSNSIAEIQRRINEKYQVLIDVQDFMEQLLTEGLIYSLDGLIIGYDDSIEYNPFLTKLAAFLFSVPMVCFYPIFFIFNVVILLLHPHIHPSSASIVIIDGYPGLNALLFFLFSGLITSLHELGHFLAGVRFGVFVRIHLSIRMFFLVAETDINGIWAASKRQRDLCYLAGFYFECVIMFFMILIQLLCKNTYAIKCSSLIKSFPIPGTIEIA